MCKKIIKNVKFFSADGMGYCVELNKFIETAEDAKQFDDEIIKARNKYIKP